MLQFQIVLNTEHKEKHVYNSCKIWLKGIDKLLQKNDKPRASENL